MSLFTVTGSSRYVLDRSRVRTGTGYSSPGSVCCGKYRQILYGTKAQYNRFHVSTWLQNAKRLPANWTWLPHNESQTNGGWYPAQCVNQVSNWLGFSLAHRDSHTDLANYGWRKPSLLHCSGESDHAHEYYVQRKQFRFFVV